MTRTNSQSARRLNLIPDDRDSYPELYTLGYHGRHNSEYGAAERMALKAYRRAHRPRITTSWED